MGRFTVIVLASFIFCKTVFAFCESKDQITVLNFQFSENELRTKIQKARLEFQLQNQKDVERFAKIDFENAKDLVERRFVDDFMRQRLEAKLFEEQTKTATIFAQLKGVKTDLLLWSTRVRESCKDVGMTEDLRQQFVAAYVEKWDARSKVFGAEVKESFKKIDFLRENVELFETQYRNGLYSGIALRTARFTLESAYRELGFRERRYRMQQDYVKKIQSLQ